MADIEEHIRRAIEEGKFKDLPGKGKPLQLDENPHEDPDWRLANHMLKTSGYSLPWIALRSEIDQEIAAARSELHRAWEWRQASLAGGKPAHEIEPEWRRARLAFTERLERINKRIGDYNLQAPAAQLQLLKLQPDQEIQQITQA